MTPSDATVSYAWYLGDTAASCTTLVADATTGTLVVDETMIGKFIKVQVTGDDASLATATTTEAVPENITYVHVTEAEQLSANSIEISFDIDATDLVKKEDIEVSDADGTLTIPINKLTLSEDGMSAVADLSVALTDGKEYDVKLNDSMTSFVASVGEVASIVITTVSAVENEKTDVKFALFDENNIDVTSTVNLDARCSVAIEGDGITSDTTKASAATVTMTTVDTTANVTVTYNSGKTDAEDIVKEGVITCIGAEAKVGTPLYADVTAGAVNQNSKCAKFYNGIAMTKPVTVEVDNTNDSIFFCAVDENGDVISYDSYKVESSNDDVVSVSTQADNGKFAEVTVSGNTVGTASLVITATYNGKDTPYTVPVTVTKKGQLDTISVTLSRTTMSNAIDDDYYGTVTVVAKDTNGNKLTAGTDYVASIEIVNEDTKSGNAHDIDDNITAQLIAATSSGFRLGATDSAGTTLAANCYTAWNDKGGSQNIKVSVSQNDIVKESTKSVTVNAIAASVWNDNIDETTAKLTYAVELEDTTLLEGTDDLTTARLAATYGGKFVGYVRQKNDGTVTVGNERGQTGTPSSVTLTTTEFTATTTEKDLDDIVFVTQKAVTPVQGTFVAEVSGPATAAGTLAFAGASVNYANGDTAATITGNLITAINNLTNSDFTAAEGTGANAGKIVLTQKVAGTGAKPVDVTAANGVGVTVANGTTGVAGKEAGVVVTGEGSTLDPFTVTYTYDATTVDDLEKAKADYAAKARTADYPASLFEVTDFDKDDVGTDTTSGWVQGLDGGSVIVIDPTTALSNITMGVKYGTRYSLTGELYDSANNVQAVDTTGNAMVTADDGKFEIETFNLAAYIANGVPYVVSGDTNQDFWFAKPGAYSVEFHYDMGTKTNQKAATGLTVKNGLNIPKVNVPKRVVDSLDENTIIEALTTNVDMNNNTSEHESIVALLGARTTVAAAGDAMTDFVTFDGLTQNNDKVTVKYAVVDEDGILYLIPINATFKLAE